MTCANIDIAKEKYTDYYGKWYRDFSFRSVIEQTVKKARECGYTPVVYDLGALGIGEPFHVEDETFNKKGYYAVEVQAGYKSRSLFKPEVVKYCLSKHHDLLVYLDGDAQLMDRIDEIKGDDFDIGVTLRKPVEFKEEWHQRLFEIAKFVNAGVIFFNPTQATFDFIARWEKCTNEVGNDQKALNQLVCTDHCPEAYSIERINGVRVKYFPCEQYNYYYFDEGLVPGIKIMHFKGMYRHYFPFDWKKRLYCMTVIPTLNKVKPLLKMILPPKNRRIE